MVQAYPHESEVNVSEDLSGQIKTMLDVEIALCYLSKFIAETENESLDEPHRSLYDKAFKGVADALNAVAAIRAFDHEQKQDDLIENQQPMM